MIVFEIFKKKGKTILIVSHALQTVEEFCDEVLLIHEGKMVSRGHPQDVILSYIRSYMGEGGNLYTQEFGTRKVEITEVVMLNAQGEESALFESSSSMRIVISYYAKIQIKNPVFGFSIKTGNGLFIYGTNTQLMSMQLPSIEGNGTIHLDFNPIRLLHGNFFLSLSIHSWDHSEQYHRREDWYPFAVNNPSKELGLFHLPCSWQHDPNQAQLNKG